MLLSEPQNLEDGRPCEGKGNGGKGEQGNRGTGNRGTGEQGERPNLPFPLFPFPLFPFPMIGKVHVLSPGRLFSAPPAPRVAMRTYTQRPHLSCE